MRQGQSVPLVSVVIPNYNGAHLLPAVLDSVARHVLSEAQAELIVVDDASTDHSLQVLADVEIPVHVLPLQTNVGFGGACNAGTGVARGEFFLFLNTDVELAEGFLAPLLTWMRERDVFAVAPRILQGGPGGQCESLSRPAFSRGLFRIAFCSQDASLDTRQAQTTLYACGAAALVRREMFAALGGFASLYRPYYWEDVDLSYRAWKRGWRVMYEPRSIAYHQAQSTISRLTAPRGLAIQMGAHALLFQWRNLGWGWLAQHLALLPAHVLVSATTGRGDFVRSLLAALPRAPEALGGRSKNRPVRTDWRILQLFRGGGASAARGD